MNRRRISVRGAVRFAALVLRSSRASEWGVHLLVFLFVASACYFISDDIPARYFFYVVSIAGYSVPCNLMGYIVNDWSDRDQDRLKKSRRLGHELSKSAIVFLMALLGLITLGIVAIFLKRWEFYVIAVVQISFSILYSVRPWRLKERGIIGIMVAAIIQRVPQFLMLAICVSLSWIETVMVSMWLTLLGILFILEHQIEDWVMDAHQNVRTLAVDIGLEKTRQISRWAYLSYGVSGALIMVFPALGFIDGPSESWFIVTFGILTTVAIGLLRWRYRYNLKTT